MLARLCNNRRIIGVSSTIRFSSVAVPTEKAKVDQSAKDEIKEIGRFYSDMVFRGREVCIFSPLFELY